MSVMIQPQSSLTRFDNYLLNTNKVGIAEKPMVSSFGCHGYQKSVFLKAVKKYIYLKYFWF